MLIMDPFETKKSLREHLISLTKELVRFPSHTKEPQKIFELVEFIKAYFEKEKVFIKSHVFGGLPSLVITTENTKHPHILLSGHIDVVPSSNKYLSEEKEQWLFGSGVMDMKGGVAVMMALLKYWSRQKIPPSLGIMITSDEEIGSSNGTIPLVEKEGYNADFVIINEGRHTYDLIVREKGVLIVKLVAEGPFMHSAYPWKGKSAIQELMKTLFEIQKIFPTPADKWATTASVTVFQGGTEKNTIPGHAEAVLNIRLTGGKRWSKDAILKKIQTRIPPHITIGYAHYGDVFLADPKNPYIRLLRKSAKQVLKKTINLGENHGASDAKVFQRNGITTVVLGPVGRNHHSPNESLNMESLVWHFDVLKKFIEEDYKSHDQEVGKVLKA